MQIKLLDPHIIEEELQALIDKIWDEETSNKTNLFDGPILQFDRIEGDTLYARVSSYRSYLATIRSEKVREELNFWVVGVTGVLQYQGKCAIAKRSKSVTHPGIWEFAPAGTLPSADYLAQLYIELEEELGVKEEDVALISFLSAEKDAKVRCVDLCMRVLLKRDKVHINNEYEAFRWISQKDLVSFSEPVSDLFVAVKKYL